jgi:hypothetical protein
MIKKESLSYLGAGMNVDPGHEARKMIDQPREKIELTFPEPMSDAVQRKRSYTRIE